MAANPVPPAAPVTVTTSRSLIFADTSSPREAVQKLMPREVIALRGISYGVGNNTLRYLWNKKATGFVHDAFFCISSIGRKNTVDTISHMSVSTLAALHDLSRHFKTWDKRWL